MGVVVDDAAFTTDNCGRLRDVDYAADPGMGGTFLEMSCRCVDSSAAMVR